MHKYLMSLILMFLGSGILAQNLERFLYSVDQVRDDKPVLDFEAIERWTDLGNYRAISNNGSWVAYELRNIPYKSSTLVVQSTEEGGSTYKWAGTKTRTGAFSDNNQWYVFQQADSLCMQPLGKGKDKHTIRYIAGITSFSFDLKQQPSWLAWQKKADNRVFLQSLSDDKELTWDSVTSYSFSASGRWFLCRMPNQKLLVYNLYTELELEYDSVLGYTFDESEKNLLLKISTREGEGLHWVRYSGKKKPEMKSLLHTAFSKGSIGSMAFDKAGLQLVFTLSEKQGNEKLFSIWYFAEGLERAVEKVPANLNRAEGLFIEKQVSFSDNGRYICFDVKARADKRERSPELADVDVWHYNDPFIQSTQMMWDYAKTALGHQPYLTVLEISSGRFTRLGGQHMQAFRHLIRDDYALVKSFVPGDRLEQYSKRIDSTWLVSLRDGQRRFLKKTGNIINFSPSGRYLLHFDETDGHYHSYDPLTGLWVNISASAPVYLGDENAYDPPDKKEAVGIAGWMANDEGVLVYGPYDIFLLDLKGINKPKNVTGGYGKRVGIRLRLTKDGWSNGSNSNTGMTKKSSLLLTGFNWEHKVNGFYRKVLGETGNPELLSEGAYLTDLHSSTSLLPVEVTTPGKPLPPLRARDAQVWMVLRQSEQTGTSYYVSNNLKQFRQLTVLQPHLSYNWYTSELVSFRQADGSQSQGVLYKPENFDPSKQYPVIIHYYRQLSQKFHEYQRPYYTNSAWINIPWFVSRGYLIFTPDIYFSKHIAGEGALNTIEGAADHLSRLPYVDSLQMGIAGHSFGGSLTNYILTHSKRFAAVFEGAGGSNYISAQFTLNPAGVPRSTSTGISTIPLTDNAKYDENPILHVGRITSPLLIFHCNEDGAMPFGQAIELYMAMRLTHKKVWLLQYDKEGHVVNNKKNQQDLTIRVTQFFDHYLKGAPPPVWMTKGVPYSLKGIETGLELDKSGDKP